MPIKLLLTITKPNMNNYKNKNHNNNVKSNNYCNKTMSIQLGYDLIVISLVECRKGEEENFFHTFNFSHPKFLYEQSLMNSVENNVNTFFQ